MLIKKFEGNSPKIDPKAFVAETAVVIGKAELKEYSSVWYNVTIRGDVNEIKVGRSAAMLMKLKLADIPMFRITACCTFPTAMPAFWAIM